MNVFLVYDDGTLVTPELNGSILEGVTRSSIIELADRARPQGRRAAGDDRRVARRASRAATITEVFACGTAAVVTPVGTLKWRGGEVSSGAEAGPVTTKIRERLLDMQYGRVEDTHGWMHRLVVAEILRTRWSSVTMGATRGGGNGQVFLAKADNGLGGRLGPRAGVCRAAARRTSGIELEQRDLDLIAPRHRVERGVSVPGQRSRRRRGARHVARHRSQPGLVDLVRLARGQHCSLQLGTHRLAPTG